MTLSAARARPGDAVRVTGANWPAGQLVQLVTCGELALPGSSSCDMRAALAAAVGRDGGFAVSLTVGEPPRPCPCVVHVSAVGAGGGGHVDAPIEISGHPTGPVPRPARTPTSLEVVEARLTGGGSLPAWLGAPHERTLVYTVRNAGTQTLTGVPLTVRVGNGADAVATPPTGELRPGETRTYQVAVPIPFAAIGDYPVTAELGGLGQARAVHRAYPWGLVLLNLVGLIMIALGVRRLLRRRRVRGYGPQLAVDGAVLLPAVVRLPDLGAYLVFDDAPGAGRMRRLAGGRLTPEDLRRLLEREAQQPTAVVDLAALDAFLTSRESR
ncbi:NEW3 domain-containing protein [Catellatospora sp. NPDC049609]|uniref:NEW3 domain-containing protein n=1 Tax=Catellatospora sp. NPDC049609 TaxID=3155505 RepID=UPI0034252BAD